MEFGWCTTLAMVKENEMENNMKNLKELTTIAKLLGEENEKRLKDAITDLLINQFEDDLENMAEYMCDYSEIFDEVRKEVTSIMKDKITKAYLEKAKEKFNELFGE